MTHIKQHLPLEISRLTPSRIDTASGRSVSVSWSNTDHENPYGEAEEFAAFIVKAVNSHDALVEALRGIQWKSADRDNMEFAARVTCYQLDAIRAALALTEDK